jgi:hypothetical protein
VSAAEILPLIRELYSRDPEYRDLAAWELQTLLWLLGYTDELEEEDEIAAACGTRRTRVTRIAGIAVARAPPDVTPRALRLLSRIAAVLFAPPHRTTGRSCART